MTETETLRAIVDKCLTALRAIECPVQAHVVKRCAYCGRAMGEHSPHCVVGLVIDAAEKGCGVPASVEYKSPDQPTKRCGNCKHAWYDDDHCDVYCERRPLADLISTAGLVDENGYCGYWETR